MTFEGYSEIAASGWTQGSYIDSSSASSLGLDVAELAGWLLVSHPCDIVARSLENEPFVDLIPVREIESIDGTYAFGGNPRKLQLALGAISIEVDLVGRQSVRRDLLALIEPAEKLDRKNARTLALWLGGRYSRPFFPDAFNERRRSSSKKVNSILKRVGQHLSGIYVDMSDEELPAGKAYDVTLLFTVTSEVAADPSSWAEVNSAADEIVALWNGEEGLAVDEYFVESEDNVPISSLRVYVRLDFDSFTIRGDEVGDQPLALAI